MKIKLEKKYLYMYVCLICLFYFIFFLVLGVGLGVKRKLREGFGVVCNSNGWSVRELMTSKRGTTSRKGDLTIDTRTSTCQGQGR
jgi:hypothetical protein